MKEFRVSKIVCLIAMVIAICCLNDTVWSQQKTVTAQEKCEVEKAWEALIKAKGGREKLYSITNMLTEFATETNLDIFPNGRWNYSIHLDGTPVVSRWQVDEPTGKYAATKGLIGPVDDLPEVRSGIVVFDVVAFLLETKWHRPELVRVNRIKKGKKQFDVIETIVEKRRVDFLFEPEEMLIEEVYFYFADGSLNRNYELLNYTTINGIKMPQAFRIGSSVFNKKPLLPISFKFNVEYDSQLFTRPLIATTRDAWKPQKQTN